MNEQEFLKFCDEHGISTADGLTGNIDICNALRILLEYFDIRSELFAEVIPFRLVFEQISKIEDISKLFLHDDLE